MTITDLAPMTQVAIEDPVLLAPGLGNGVFYVKIFASVNENPTTPQDPLLGVLNIRDIYFIAWLERETEGLFPAFYVF